MTDILTAALVIITGLYAYYTYKILRANEGVLQEMRSQQELLYRPYVSIFPILYSDTPIFYLKIKNTGQTAAYNLKLSLDRNFYQFGEHSEGRNLKSYKAFTEPIFSFVPNAELLFYLAQSFMIFSENADEAVTPAVFTVTAEYEYLEKKVTESTVVDLRPYLNNAVPHEPVVANLQEIKKAIEKLGKK